MKTVLRYIIFGFLILINCQISRGQSETSKLLDGAVLEFSLNPGFAGDFDWKIDQQGIEPLNFLTPTDDEAGLLKDIYSPMRPMSVSVHKTDYGESYFDFPSYDTYELMAKLLINSPKDPRLYFGLTLNYGNSYFNERRYHSLSDVQFGKSNTSYFIESNVYDTIFVDFNSSQEDSMFVFPRSKIVFVEKPQHNFGLGFQLRYVINDNENFKSNNRFRWTWELGMTLSSSLKSPTTVYWTYFDYHQYGTLEIDDVELDDPFIWWKNRPSLKLQDFTFIAPAIMDVQLYYGLNLAIKPVLKWPVRLGLRWNITHHMFSRKGQQMATNMVSSGGFVLQYELGRGKYRQAQN